MVLALAEQLKWWQAGELSAEDRHVGELVVNDGRSVKIFQVRCFHYFVIVIRVGSCGRRKGRLDPTTLLKWSCKFYVQ